MYRVVKHVDSDTYFGGFDEDGYIDWVSHRDDAVKFHSRQMVKAIADALTTIGARCKVFRVTPKDDDFFYPMFP